jgi:hypothetical protein
MSWGGLEPLGTYEDLLAHMETVAIGGHRVHGIGLDDLIQMRHHP